MSTPLTLYGADLAASTLTHANKFVKSTGGTSISETTVVGTSTGWGELWSQGKTTAWAAAGSMGSPTGHGWLWDNTNLANVTFPAGTWTPKVTLKLGSAGAGNSINFTINVNLYAYDTGNSTYTLIGTCSDTGQSLTNGTQTTVTFSGTALSAFTFNATQRFYVDCWLDITSTSSSSGSATVAVFQSSTGFGIASFMEIDTPGIQQDTDDAAVRFLLMSAANLKDSATRFRLMSASLTKDASTRFRLMSASQLKDTTARVRLMSASLSKDAGTRLRLMSASLTKDSGMRLRLMSATHYRDVSTRLRLMSSLLSKDAASRLRLMSGATPRDSVCRFVLYAPSSQVAPSPFVVAVSSRTGVCVVSSRTGIYEISGR